MRMFRRTHVLSAELTAQLKVGCDSRTAVAVETIKADKEMPKVKAKEKGRRMRKAGPCVSNFFNTATAVKEQTVIIAMIHLHSLEISRVVKETEPAAKRRRRIKAQVRTVRTIIKTATTTIQTVRTNKEHSEAAKERAKAKAKTNRIRISLRCNLIVRRCCVDFT